MQGPEIREISPVGTDNTNCGKDVWNRYVLNESFEWKSDGVMGSKTGEGDKDEMT